MWILVLFAGFLILYVLPFVPLAKRLQKGRETSLIFLQAMVLGLFFVTYLVYGLVLLKAYSQLSLLGGYLLLIAAANLVLFKWPRSPTPHAQNTESTLTGKTGEANIVPSRFLDVILLIVLMVAAVVRFYDPISFYAFKSGDGYQHLFLLKQLEYANEIFGILYLRGYHTILSPLQFFANALVPSANELVAAYYTIRYVGPIVGILTVFAVYVLVSQMTSSRIIGLFSASILGFYTQWEVGIAIERQAMTLTQEYASLLMLPAFTFAYLYLRDGKSSHLLGFAFASSLVFFAHPYSSIILLVMLAALLLAFFLERAPRRRVLPLILACGLATLPVVSYLVLSTLAGNPLGTGQSAYSTRSLTMAFQAPNPFTVAVVISSFALIVAPTFQASKKPRLPWTALGVAGAFLLGIYYSGALGLQIFRNLGKAYPFVALVGTMVVGGLFGLAMVTVVNVKRITLGLPRRAFSLKVPNARLLMALPLAAILLIAAAFPPMPIYGNGTYGRVSYDEEVRVLLSIVDNYAPGQVTVFSATSGAVFYRASLSGRALSVAHALLYPEFNWQPLSSLLSSNPETFRADSPFAFIIVEKIPHPLRTSDPLFVEQQKLALEWCTRYLSVRSNMTVYFENENLIVYLVTR